MHTWHISPASLLMQSLGWALLHSLWQGALIFGFLWCLLKALRNTSATIKYYLSFVSFAGVAIWFAVTWINQWQRLQATTTYIVQAGATGVKLNTVSALPAGTLQGIVLPQLSLYIPLIVCVYVLGLVFMLLRFGVNIFQVQALRSTGITKPEAQLKELLRRRMDDFKITRHVRLYFSNRVQTPVMIGLLKPIILFPIATINHLSMEQVEAILLHELAHIKRHDYLLNMLQTIVETILFFNPFIWLISSIIRKEREHCCDDLVIACTAQPLPYAKALAILEASRMDANAMMLAATGQKNQLFNRIKRIMEMKKNATSNSQFFVVLLAIIALAITVTCFTPSYAQKKNIQNSTDTTKSKTVVHEEEKITVIDANGNVHTYNSMDDVPQKDKDKLKNNGNVISTNNRKVMIISDDENDDNNDVDATANGKSKVIIIKKDNKKTEDNAGVSGEDMSKMIEEITKVSLTAADSAMKQIDWAQVNKSIKEAKAQVADIDWAEITKNIEEAKKDAADAAGSVDWNAIEAEIKSSLKDVDAEMKKPNKEMQEDIEKELKNSKAELEKASVEVKEQMAMAQAQRNNGASYSHVNSRYDDMLAMMREEGLISETGKYKLKRKDNTLYINGNRQPQEIYEKYSHYMHNRNVTIKGDKNNISINVND